MRQKRGKELSYDSKDDIDGMGSPQETVCVVVVVAVDVGVVVVVVVVGVVVGGGGVAWGCY